MRGLAAVGLSLLLMSCKSISVKIYAVDADAGGLVRKQENELLPFDKAKGYLCTSPSDFETIMQACSNAYRSNACQVTSLGQD